jgi:hypothetical protein
VEAFKIEDQLTNQVKGSPDTVGVMFLLYIKYKFVLEMKFDEDNIWPYDHILKLTV